MLFGKPEQKHFLFPNHGCERLRRAPGRRPEKCSINRARFQSRQLLGRKHIQQLYLDVGILPAILLEKTNQIRRKKRAYKAKC
jgi:hypothetical protein